MLQSDVTQDYVTFYIGCLWGSVLSSRIWLNVGSMSYHIGLCGRRCWAACQAVQYGIVGSVHWSLVQYDMSCDSLLPSLSLLG